MAEKKPELPETPLPCPFCGSTPRVIWNGGMTIKCTNPECCQPKTGWWYDVYGCVAQWNRRHTRAEVLEIEISRLRQVRDAVLDCEGVEMRNCYEVPKDSWEAAMSFATHSAKDEASNA